MNNNPILVENVARVVPPEELEREERDNRLNELGEQLAAERRSRRRIILVILGVVLTALAVVGGVCGGSDVCRPQPATSLAAESSLNPTLSPSLPPIVLERRANLMIELIENVTEERPGEDDLAFAWLVNEDAAFVDPLAERKRAIQRYALARLFQEAGPGSLIATQPKLLDWNHSAVVWENDSTGASDAPT